MEFAYISENSVRIKGKQVALTTNLLGAKSKVVSDAVLLTGKEHATEFFNTDLGVVLQGPGEYETKGTKITGFAVEEDTMYTVTLEGLAIFVGNVTSADKAKDKLHEHDVAILFADEVLSQNVLGILNARIVIFVDGKAEENAKAFGKEYAKTSKYAVTKDKLPSETEFIFLG